MMEYSGIYGEFHWEIKGRTLKVFSARARIGELLSFEQVNAVNAEQAQWSAQGKIDLNLSELRRIEAEKAASQAD